MTIPALSADRKAAFQQLASGQISDAMEALGLPRTVITGLRVLAPYGVTMVGTAVTIRQIPKNAASDRSARLVKHGEVVKEVAGAGNVVIVDVGGRCETATWGENHSRRAKAKGIAGAVIFGATRDVAAIREIGLPLFHLGASPIKSQWDLETAAINEPVTIDNVHIRPGDIVFGDEDGVIVIPPEHCEAVLARAVKVRQKERDAKDRETA